MNRLTTAFFGLALPLLGTFQCIGEEAKPGPDYEQLKAMEWIIGDWEADWVVPSGGSASLDGYPPGAKVHSTGSDFWMENKSYIGYKFRDEIDGKVVHQGFEMVGVDPQSKKLIHWLFSIMGGWGTGEWSVEGNTWTLKWSATAADRTKYEGVSFLVPIDADTYTWEMKDNKKNGTEAPDTPLITFRRVSQKPGPSADEPTAEDYITMQQNYFAGEWTTKVIEGEGAGSTGTWICRLDSNGKSFHETATSDGKPFLHSIGGYDPQLKAFKEVVFYADGSTATLLYRHPLKTIQGSLIGKVLEGTMERVSPDGKQETLQVLVNPAEPNKSFLTINKMGNQGDPMVKVVFERKKK